MNRNGFTLVEVLLSLSISLLILLNVTSIVKLKHIRYVNFNEDIPTGAKQLSNYLMTGTVDEIGHKLTYKDQSDRTFTVRYNNHRLVKRPGYETLIYDIDQVRFDKQDHLIFMTVTRDHQDFTYLIAENYEKTKKEEKEENQDEEEDTASLPAIESAGVDP